MDHRAVKNALNQQFARMGAALASPRRIELLDVLAQGERGVEALAVEAEMTLALASAHLQVLWRAHLVERRRDGARVLYRLADDDVYRLLSSLRDVARTRLAEVELASARYVRDADGIEPVSRDELAARLAAGRAIVLDVRPRAEYLAGHIPGARSVPLDELEARLAEVSRDREVVAYCRGPYCVLAPAAVAMLRRHGYRARLLADGLPEWRLAGLPVVPGAS